MMGLYISNIRLSIYMGVAIKSDVADKMINTIIMITKWYIYRTRCCNEKLSFPDLVKNIAMYKSLEYAYATKNRIKSKHEAKWALYVI